MEKLRFAIQVLTFTLALPVYFYVELSKTPIKAEQTVKEPTTVVKHYTKNGKDRTLMEAVNGTFQTKPVYKHSFN